MTRSTVAEPAFDVPDLDLPSPRVTSVQGHTAWPSNDSTYDTTSYRFEQEERDATWAPLELEATSREVDQRFVAAVPEPMVPVSRFRSGLPDLPPPAVLTSTDVALDAIKSVPLSIWKRLPAYAFLAMVLGNGCKCGGLSAGTNISLTLLLVVGILGLIGSSIQRSP